MSPTYKYRSVIQTHLYNYTSVDMTVLVNFLFDGGYLKEAGTKESEADVSEGSLAYDWVRLHQFLPTA